MRTSADDFAVGANAGLLLVGHGSREPEGIDEFLATARLASARAGAWAVEPCFLEFARPSIAEAFEKLAQRGVRRIVVAPVMLFAAGHIRRDIPAAVAAVAAGHPDLTVEQAEHLGCHEAIVALSRWRYDQTVAGQPPMRPERTALVIVGRGSHDACATAEMFQFVRLRQQGARVGQAHTAFLAMADPPLAEVFEAVVSSRPRRVVVQPHLLFGGVLLARIRGIVERFAREHPQAQWLVTGHLGPSEFVVRAIVERACAAGPAPFAGAAIRPAGSAGR